MTDQFEVGYALLIGIDENAVPKLALPDVAKDIAALQSVLIHPERCAYPPDNVKVITGHQATCQGIQDGLAWIYDKLQADSSGNTTGKTLKPRKRKARLPMMGAWPVCSTNLWILCPARCRL
jgi:hypothetical protein